MRHELRTLTGELADRPATSVGEQQAARHLADALRRATQMVWQEPFASFCSPRPAWVIILAMSLLGGLLFWVLPWFSIAFSLLAALGFAAQAMGWLELGWLFPTGESQNVVGVIPARGEIRARLVILAHYDTGSRVWAGRSFLLIATLVMLLPLDAMLAAALSAKLWDALLILSLAGIALGLWLVMHETAEDRNDAGVAVALTAGSGPSLAHTEVWTVFTGSRVPGLVGMRAFLHRHGRLLADAHFVVLEEEDGTLLTFQQRQAEAAVITQEVRAQVTLLTVDPADMPGAVAQVRKIAEGVDQQAIGVAL